MVDKTIDLTNLQGKTLYIATPLHSGQAHSSFLLSMLQLQRTFYEKNVGMFVQIVDGESLITRARNGLVQEFLKKDCDFLLFIDGDIGFGAEDVLFAMQEMTVNPERKIITSIYPQKSFLWENVEKARQLGFIKDKNDYEKYSGKFGVNFEGPVEFYIEDFVEVTDASTGWMMIDKKVFLDMQEAFPDKKYLEYGTEEEKFAWFDCIIHPETKRYLSEDYAFTYLARLIGYKTWLMPWVNLTHTGAYTYKATFRDWSVAKYEWESFEKQETEKRKKELDDLQDFLQ